MKYEMCGDPLIAYSSAIYQIIHETEEIQDSKESDYTKEQEKIHAYEEIVELLKGDL